MTQERPASPIETSQVPTEVGNESVKTTRQSILGKLPWALAFRVCVLALLAKIAFFGLPIQGDVETSAWVRNPIRVDGPVDVSRVRGSVDVAWPRSGVEVNWPQSGIAIDGPIDIRGSVYVDGVGGSVDVDWPNSGVKVDWPTRVRVSDY